jgi:hypothetical protein
VRIRSSSITQVKHQLALAINIKSIDRNTRYIIWSLLNELWKNICITTAWSIQKLISFLLQKNHWNSHWFSLFFEVVASLSLIGQTSPSYTLDFTHRCVIYFSKANHKFRKYKRSNKCFVACLACTRKISTGPTMLSRFHLRNYHVSTSEPRKTNSSRVLPYKTLSSLQCLIIRRLPIDRALLLHFLTQHELFLVLFRENDVEIFLTHHSALRKSKYAQSDA